MKMFFSRVFRFYARILNLEQVQMQRKYLKCKQLEKSMKNNHYIEKYTSYTEEKMNVDF